MSWLSVAKKEYLENVRNAWVIVVSAAFLLLTILSSSFANFSGPEAGGARSFADIVTTLAAMQALSGFLLPILALVLAFGTIAGERESGSLALLVAQPLSRGEIVAGKWLGLWGVLATTILLGFGLGGLFVVAQTSGEVAAYQVLFAFLLVTLAWGAAWISVALFVSAFFQRRGTAIAGAIGAWVIFGRFVWNMLTLLLAIAVLGPRFEELFESGRLVAPSWLILTQLLNPNAVHDGLLVTLVEDYPSIIGEVARRILPDLYNPYLFAIAMAAWIVLPYLGAHALFKARDV